MSELAMTIDLLINFDAWRRKSWLKPKHRTRKRFMLDLFRGVAQRQSAANMGPEVVSSNLTTATN